MNGTLSVSERRLIEIIWWIGLAGALVATLAILKQVALVLRALQDIHKLAAMTRESADGIARNVAPISGLGAIAPPAEALDRETQTLAATAAAIQSKLSGLVPQAQRS